MTRLFRYNMLTSDLSKGNIFFFFKLERKHFELDFIRNRRGGVELQRLPRMREIGVRSPVETDLSHKIM